MTVDRRAVAEAAARIEGRVRRTPVIEVDVDGVAVVLKLELLQHTGSFKPRGAFNRVLSEPRIPRAGLIAASGGNHGLAVAFVASRLGIPAEIFVAEVTPEAKRDPIRRLGATLRVGGAMYQDALDASRRRAAETGALEVHAYDHPATVAGQGTMARELEDQISEPGPVLMAVGGGGFIGGAAAWFGGRVPLVAVEPERAPTLARALEAGHPVDVEVGGVAADSLGAKRIGAAPFQVVSGVVDRVVQVTDEAILDARRRLWDLVRIVAEPGGATAFAALSSGRWRPAPGERPVVVVCGANTDPGTVTSG